MLPTNRTLLFDMPCQSKISLIPVDYNFLSFRNFFINIGNKPPKKRMLIGSLVFKAPQNLFLYWRKSFVLFFCFLEEKIIMKFVWRHTHAHNKKEVNILHHFTAQWCLRGGRRTKASSGTMEKKNAKSDRRIERHQTLAGGANLT